LRDLHLPDEARGRIEIGEMNLSAAELTPRKLTPRKSTAALPKEPSPV